MSPLLTFALALVALAAAAGGFGLRARLRRRAITAGSAVRLAARLRGDGRYPSRWTAGALVIEGERLGWGPRGSDEVLVLGSAGLSVFGVRPRRAREWSLNENALVIAMRDRSGATLELAVRDAELDNALAVLRVATQDPEGAVDQLQPQRLARVPVTAAAVLTVAAVLTTLLAYLYTAGRTTDAVVTGHDEGFCSVVWTDPWDGRSQRAGVDCAASSQVGSAVRILALPTLFRGEAFDLYDSHYFSGVALSGLWLCGVAGIAVRARHRRADVQSRPGLTPVAATPVQTLTPDDVAFGTVAAAAASRRGQIASPRVVRPRTGASEGSWWRIPVLRGFVTGGAVRAFGGVAVLAFAVLIGWSYWSAAWHLSQDPTAVTTAKVDDWIDGELPLFPHDVYTLIPVGGREVEALVAAADLPDEPPVTVQVRYSTSHPSAAELVQGSALARGALLTGAAATGAVGWLLWAGLGTARDVRRLQRAARSERGTTFRFVVTTDVEGDGALVLYDPVPDQPRWLLFVTASELERLPHTGDLRLLGDLRQDGVVVAKHGSDTIWPTATLLHAEPTILCEVVNGLPVDAA